MTFLTVSFGIAGLLAVSIPILLHLIMRQKPKQVLFPAFAFLRRQEKKVRRNLTLQHLMLLFFRCAVLLLLGLALARPSCRPNLQSPAGRADGPVAAVLAVDTSVRMGILAENQSRLEKAQSTARRILAGLPPGSEAAVLDSAASSDFFQIDLLAAEEALDRLEAGSSLRPIAETVAEGVRLLNQSPLSNRELFIFTDKTAAGWPETAQVNLKRLLAQTAENENLTFYWTDCSTEKNLEWGITSLTVTPSSDASPARVDLELTHTGDALSGTLEFWLLDSKAGAGDQDSPLPEKRLSAQKTLSVPVAFEESAENERKTMTIYPPNLPEGCSLGFVRLLPDDAFGADNIRWFAVNRGKSAKILLAASEPVEDKTLFIQQALAPNGSAASSIPYQFSVCSQAQLESMPNEELTGYAAVLLLDPAHSSPELADRLTSYVSAGGRLGLFFGSSWQAFERNEAGSQTDQKWFQLLGGTLSGPVRRAGKGVLWVPSETEHPVLAEIRPLIHSSSIPWTELPVYRYWKYTPADSNGQETILQFSDSAPGLISRTLGTGMVLASFTPFSDSASNANAWNRLTTGESAWVFLMLTDGIARTLVSGGGENMQLAPGETALLRPNEEPFPESVTLELPSGEQVQIPADTEHRLIRFSGRTKTGPYRLFSESEPEKFSCAFCVNDPAAEFDLTELDAETLQSYLAPFTLESASDTAAIATSRFTRHFGREFYPFLILLLGLFLAAETVLSNRFYR